MARQPGRACASARPGPLSAIRAAARHPDDPGSGGTGRRQDRAGTSRRPSRTRRSESGGLWPRRERPLDHRLLSGQKGRSARAAPPPARGRFRRSPRRWDRRMVENAPERISARDDRLARRRRPRRPHRNHSWLWRRSDSRDPAVDRRGVRLNETPRCCPVYRRQGLGHRFHHRGQDQPLETYGDSTSPPSRAATESATSCCGTAVLPVGPSPTRPTSFPAPKARRPASWPPTWATCRRGRSSTPSQCDDLQ